MKLRHKILLFSASLILLIGVPMVFYIKTTLNKTLMDELHERAIFLTKYLARESADDLLIQNYLALQLKMNDLIKINHDIEYIYIIDFEGKIAVHTFQNGFPIELLQNNEYETASKLGHSLRLLNTEIGKIYEVAAHILKSQVGRIHVGYKLTDIENRMAEVTSLMITIVISVLMLGGLIAIFISNRLAKPLSNLTTVAKTIGDGDMTHRVINTSMDEIGALSTSFNKMADNLQKAISYRDQEIAERKKAEEKIQSSLKEKEVLLKEIHHRVKNNFQVIISLLKLQNRNITDENIKAVLSDSENRIRSMSLVHEMLYRTEDLAHIDFGNYVQKLTQYMLRTYKITPDRAIIKTEIKDITLNTDTSIILGLVINELFSNAMKYAFPGDRCGEISISMKAGELKNEYELIIKDNGAGLPEGLDIWKTDTLGLRMVTNLITKQLRGSIELKRGGGTEFQIRFNELVYPDRLKEKE